MDCKPILLVDARNLMYRAIFANKKDARRGSTHHFTVMIRFMWNWIDKFKPSSINVFWDAPKDSLWRKRIYPEYKVRNENEYFDDIKDDLIFTQQAAKAVFANMGVRQFAKDGTEADDLIYSACRLLSPGQMVIVSTDHDYEQIVFRMQSVSLWNPMQDGGRGKFAGCADHDPAVAKALTGDKSDNIAGYRGIGPVKGAKLARCLADRQKFLDNNGREIFVRNLLLVDLSMNPNLLKNDQYVQSVLATEPKFDKQAILEAAKKHKIGGLIAEYDRILVPFKLLSESA